MFWLPPFLSHFFPFFKKNPPHWTLLSPTNRATKIPGAGPIETLHEAPGGGRRVTIIDPEGFPFNLIYGQSPELEESRIQPDKLIYNYESEKTRIGQFQRFKEGPAAVHKVYMLSSLASLYSALHSIQSLILSYRDPFH